MTHAPEQLARQEIERQLAESGWLVQDPVEIRTTANSGVAVRQFPIKQGYADYVLIVDEANYAAVTVVPTGQAFTRRVTRSETPTYEAAALLSGGVVAYAYLSTVSAIRFTSSLQPSLRCDEITRFHTPRELLAIIHSRESESGRRRRSWMDGLSVFDALRTARRQGQSATVGDLTDVLDSWSVLTQTIDLASSVSRDWTEAGDELFPTFFGHELCARFLGCPTDTGRDDLTFSRRNPWEWIIPYHRRGHSRIAPLFDQS